jgi:thymidylate synthase (FAD)
MKVSLINCTAEARELLIFTKKTRLAMSSTSFDDIRKMSDEEKDKELRYVFGTIGSSWEFVDYVFMIEGVTRAFTHQLVRHRVGVSFAQQAQRVVDFSGGKGFEYLTTGKIATDKVLKSFYDECMDRIQRTYSILVGSSKDYENVGGAAPQDARGILPTNILTNICMKINLRSLSHLLNVRLCKKAQGEFQDVAKELLAKTLEIHPWASPVLRVHCAQHGSCLFPGYEECPVRGYIPKVDKDVIQEAWSYVHHEAQPKGDGGFLREYKE